MNFILRSQSRVMIPIASISKKLNRKSTTLFTISKQQRNLYHNNFLRFSYLPLGSQLIISRGTHAPVQLRTFSLMKSVEEGVSELNIRAPPQFQDNTEELIAASIAAGTLNPLNEDGTEKSRNQLKNELKKAAKLEKFNAKQCKVKTEAPVTGAVGKMKTLDKKCEIDEALLKVPPGEKKPMDGPMADSYSPKAVEACWYSWWEKEGFFSPEYANKPGKQGEREKFVMVVPPPNVTGSLHLGHTLTAAVEDSLSRWHRMKGHEVLYIPGSDHAGIATQAVVERRIMKERNITKHEMGREAFLAEVWKWRDTYGDRIYDQFRRMGSSVDWNRVCFTLDPKAVTSVNEAFCRLFDDGLIFRANRLVHWSGKLKTALSDLEVEMREIEPRSRFSAHGHDPKKTYEFGVMTSFAYTLEGDSSKEIVISTTRPETVFADVAIAVNPADERYTEFHGKKLVHPVTGSLIPVICDDAADPQFGTGALKVSPGHDHTDFEIGRRHGLPCISVFDENNVLLPLCGPGFAGLPRYEAREAVLVFCKANGTFRGDAPHSMTLPICTRSGDFVEPRMMPQWWLNCKQMAADAVESVRSGELQLFPKEHERDWYYWLENIRDWCLSRQLWWGHRVPAYRVCGLSEEAWVAGRSEGEALEKARAKFPEQAANLTVLQDEDVLDTWFSAGLWPLTTLNWPDAENSDFQRFYPQSLLETGSDILFFWVARMVMFGKYLTGKLPFTQVLLHAMVRDAHGRKMSKSLGNVIDPIDVIEGCTLEALQAQLDGGNLDSAEVAKAKAGQKQDFPQGIPECGIDALRFALCNYVAQGRDINLNINKVEGYRRFCNKLWNAMKFALMKLGPDFRGDCNDLADFSALRREDFLAVDLWMLAKIARASEAANKNFACFNLMNVTAAIHYLWLYELCDVYIEAVKPVLATQESSRKVLYFALEQGLRLLHPVMPFITEELFQRLPRANPTELASICVAEYPEMDSAALPALLLEKEAEFDQLYELIKCLRSSVMDRKLPPKTTKLALLPATDTLLASLKSNESALQALVKSVGSVEIVATATDGEMLELMSENEKFKCQLFISKA